jgi:S1-C subfamily serine protease
MDLSRPHRPRISRETRLLLVTAILAVAALWVLARVRFPDRPAAPNPVQPFLTQLTARPTFGDLAEEISQLQPRLEPLLFLADGAPRAGGAAPGSPHDLRLALRIRDDLAAVLLDGADRTAGTDMRQHVAGFDPASHLAIVRVPGPPAPPPVPWRPAEPRRPRYLIATDISTTAPSLRPVFVGSLEPIASPVWGGQIWLAPAHATLVPGSFVFTSDGLLAGLVVQHDGGRAIVPGEVLLAEAERLVIPIAGPPGDLGVTVQALTPPVSRATGAASGVVVTWVDPSGPSAEALAAGDVIEAADDVEMPTPLHWDTRTSRLTAGETIAVRVRRGGELAEVPLTAARASSVAATASLGLTLRAVPGAGSEVVRVEPGSVAESAGLAAGDLLTRVGGAAAPSPAAIRAAFDATLNGEAVLVAVTRADTHHVTALEKW